MRDEELGFESIWLKLETQLQEDQEIRRWSQHRGYTGGTPFRIDNISDDFVKVEISTGIRRIPKKDFENVYDVWDGYIHGNIKRSEITDMTWHSTYIISIFHYLNV